MWKMSERWRGQFLDTRWCMLLHNVGFCNGCITKRCLHNTRNIFKLYKMQYCCLVLSNIGFLMKVKIVSVKFVLCCSLCRIHRHKAAPHWYWLDLNMELHASACTSAHPKNTTKKKMKGGPKQSHKCRKFHFKNNGILSLSYMQFILLPPRFILRKI